MDCRPRHDWAEVSPLGLVRARAVGMGGWPGRSCKRGVLADLGRRLVRGGVEEGGAAAAAVAVLELALVWIPGAMSGQGWSRDVLGSAERDFSLEGRGREAAWRGEGRAVELFRGGVYRPM